MRSTTFFKLLVFAFVLFYFISCDKEYSSVGDSLLPATSFELATSSFEVTAYNEKVDSIQSNNLRINPLGIYNNLPFGKKIANFATQVVLSGPSFTVGNNPIIESILLEIPYFIDPRETKIIASTTPNVPAGSTYVLDSIYGTPLDKMKLSIFESGRFMGNQVGASQTFYTNQNDEFDRFKVGKRLNDDANVAQNDAFFFNPAQNAETIKDADNKETTIFSLPGMKLKLNASVFKDKLFSGAAGSVVSNETFINSFKGLYFKIEESEPNKGNIAMINFAAGKITIKYTEDSFTTPVTKIQRILRLNLSTTTASLLQESALKQDYVTATTKPNRLQGDNKLYVKGGEGSMAVISLFKSDDAYGYEVVKNTAQQPIDENGKVIPLDSNGNAKSGYFMTYFKKIGSNGVPDQLDDIRFPLIDNVSSQIYYSRKKTWLVNTASLVFTIDSDLMKTSSHEPERLFLYDYTNNKTSIDYLVSATADNKNRSKVLFGGFIKRDATTAKRGVSYTFNVTNHIRDLINNTNVKNIKLGLVVTENINNTIFYKVNSKGNWVTQIPEASITNPLGTILFGGKSTSTNPSLDKRIKLEISYTKPK